MSHPFIFARTTPDKAAVVMAESGRSLTFRQLEENANRNAHLLRGCGLKIGDGVAAMLENGPAMLELAWAADRAGLYFTAISTRLTAQEAEYILLDSGAKAFFASPGLAEITDVIAERMPNIPIFVDEGSNARCIDWTAAIAELPVTPIVDEAPGAMMLYSSGTTGRPKGVRRPLPQGSLLTAPSISGLMQQVYGVDEHSVYLCPAPLYHAAPLGFTMMAHRLGCTVVVMERFDAEAALRSIETFKVSIAQFVPTHFVRLLKLPAETRTTYDVSTLRTVIHAAAPCPVKVKEQMMQWWGPILHEYYAGTEGNGMTAIGPSEWMLKKGSVGKPLGCSVHICDPTGRPLRNGEEGLIYFAGGGQFEYHNDDDKTRQSRNYEGWSTLGDIGYLDSDGYLFLTDRQSFTIISGGVNIYPQEIENLLVLHPDVMDVAVIGAPDEDLGERAVAVVQAACASKAGPALAAELHAFCKQHLSGVKVPKQFDFVPELPRQPTGKLYKRLIRARYWNQAPPSG